LHGITVHGVAQFQTLDLMRYLLPLFIVIFSSFLSVHADEDKSDWHICIFDRPSAMHNHGQKIIIAYIVNPFTKRWEPVWEKSSKEDTRTFRRDWVNKTLEFQGRGDNLHNGETLQILKPVEIAFVGFKTGKIDITFDVPPQKQFLSNGPPQ